MAADYTGNPIRMDTDNDAIPSPLDVVLIQWVNTAGAEIAVDDDLVLTVNGTAINFRIDAVLNMSGAVCASIPLGGIRINTLVVTTIDGGEVHVWYQGHPPESVVP